MVDVLLSLWSLMVFIAIGFVLVKANIAPPSSDRELSRIAFYALMPALIFSAVSQSDLGEVFSTVAVANLAPIVILFGLYYILAVKVFGMRGGEQTIGALAASYTNAGNIGAAYLVAVTGNASGIAPIVTFQLCVMTPFAFSVLARQTGLGGRGVVRKVLNALSQPPVIGVIAGVVVSGFGIDLPRIISVPVDTLATVAVPIMMMAIGISLASAKLPHLDRELLPLATAVGFQILLAPLVTFAVASALGLEGMQMLSVMVLSTIPTANNVFNYAHRYGTGVILARDSVLITVLLSMPALVVVVALFHA